MMSTDNNDIRLIKYALNATRRRAGRITNVLPLYDYMCGFGVRGVSLRVPFIIIIRRIRSAKANALHDGNNM